MSDNTKISQWQLLHCIHGYDGLEATQETEPERYAGYIEDYYGIAGFFIGRIVEFNGEKTAIAILEGKKEVLDIVMEWRDKYLAVKPQKASVNNGKSCR